MILYYKFNDIRANVLYSPEMHANAGWFTPHRHEEICDNYDFDYQVEVKPIDLAEFITGRDSKQINESYLEALKDVINELQDDIEENERFQEFMKEKYEDEAHEKAQEEALEC